MMARIISKYDRMRALVRNPQYLRDLEAVERGVLPRQAIEQAISEGKLPANADPEDIKIDCRSMPKGFNPEALLWFLGKYNLSLSVPITKDLIDKYPSWVWEKTAVFSDDVIVKIIFNEEPKMVEIETSVYPHDLSPCLKDGKSLILQIDLTGQKKDIKRKVNSYIDYFKRYVDLPTLNRRKHPDEKIDRFDVWDEYKKCRDFAEIGKKLQLDERDHDK